MNISKQSNELEKRSKSLHVLNIKPDNIHKINTAISNIRGTTTKIDMYIKLENTNIVLKLSRSPSLVQTSYQRRTLYVFPLK